MSDHVRWTSARDAACGGRSIAKCFLAFEEILTQFIHNKRRLCVSLRSRGDSVVARSVRKDLMMIKNSEPVDSN